ncbi:MAG: hypothetical protein JHC95_00435 [Solirubrobacteraceae bacterium]|nr:hypothetical protein [Solirubrobacteraceae bacterium]
MRNRTKLVAGLVTFIAAGSLAGPAVAQETADQEANAPQVHVDTCKVVKAKAGFTYATCPLTMINNGKDTVYVNVTSNLKTYAPTKGAWMATSGKIGIPGAVHPDEVQQVYPMRFAFKGKTVSQVKKELKVTISNPTGGAIITDPIATA